MGDLVIGPAIKLLISAGKELYTIHSQFKPRMTELIDALATFEPVFTQFENSENSTHLAGVLKGFHGTLLDGQALIEKCLEVTPLQFLKQRKYNNELVALERALCRQMQALSAHAIKDKKDASGARATNGSSCKPPDPILFTFGLDKPVRELKTKLLGEKKSTILVLTAPGGFGKTTLAKKFCHDADVKEKFRNNIFFVRVPKNPNLDDIVEQLHRCRRSRLASTSQIEANAVNKGLHNFVEEAGKKPLLLVFDDVWPGSEHLIERFAEIKMQNYKILVTSRSDLPRFGSTYYLKSLKKKDAMDYFTHSASLEDSNTNISTEYIEQILEHCKGLPQAIELVGKSLSRKPEISWKQTNDQLSGGSILESVGGLRECLEKSLYALNKGDEKSQIIKKCFIDLGVFLQDQTIPAAALIDIWPELHEELKDDEDYHCIAYLHEITLWSLANLVFPRRGKTEMMENDDYYSQHFVVQHNMLRELAIRQSNCQKQRGDRLIIDVPKQKFPNWWKEGMYHQPINVRLVSISSEGVLSKEWDKMKLPKAEVLVLHFQAQQYALPKFLKTMSRSLKVLIVTNHGLLHARVSKFSLLDSLSSLKRVRFEGISIPSMKRNSIKIESLQKISLFMCNFDQASSKSSIKILEAFPNLVEINIDFCNSLKELPAKLCDLLKLKKLSITNCDTLHALPKEIGKLVNLELLRLLACIKLLQLPCSISKLIKLQLLDISDCWSIENLPDAIGEIHSLKKLRMRHCPGLRRLPKSILNLKQEIKVTCDVETKKSWDDLPCPSNIDINVTN